MKRGPYRIILVLMAAAVLGFAGEATATAAPPSGQANGGVLPPSTRPYGVSLTDVASQAALFQSSLNAGNPPGSPISAPPTRFQILYTFPGSTNQFQVRAGTFLYVPVFNVDDSPPVAGCVPPGVAGGPGCKGVYPSTNLQARSYFFDRTQLGSHDLTITVDGVTTPIGPDYLAGPVDTPPLLDSAVPGVFGTHMFFVAAFVRPLRPGVHTVNIGGTADGPYIQMTYGIASFSVSVTYTVAVSG